MKNRLNIAKMLSLTLFTAVLSGNGLAQVKVDDIEALIRSFEAREHFSGVVLVAQNEEVLFRKAYGLANREWEVPNTVDTKFRIGSLTKQFTSFLIMRLVEQGKIDLSGKICDYLPYYRKDSGTKITIHHLLTHTSGLPMFSRNPLPEERLGPLYSTVDDFVVWDKVLSSGSLLSKRLTETMLSPHVAGENYGYGWYVEKDKTSDPSRPVTICSHGGGITQFNNLVVRRIEERILIVIFSNVYGTRLGAMSKGINNILHNKPAGVSFQGL